MGRRSNQTTKSGRFMNPADQQRKAERAKELKRNKKQRGAVRTAIMKNRDPNELIDALRKIDEQELESDVPLRVTTESKRDKLKKQYKEIRDFFIKAEQPDKVKEIDGKMIAYEAERYRKSQQMAAIKFSMTGDMDSIPMPEAVPTRDNAAMTPYLPSYAVQPAGYQPPLKKKVTFSARLKQKPPGPPVGIPPELSDSEEEGEEGDGEGLHDEDNFEPVVIPDEILNSNKVSALTEPLRPAPIPPPVYPTLNLARAPPVHPSMLPLPPRLPIRLPPPPPTGGAFRTPDPSSITAAPTVAKPTPDAVISAKPELRDLAGEATRFVPTNLRVRREDTFKKPIGRVNAYGMATESATKKAAKSTDEAYADFMKEMDGLL
ncbi:hypothetical protein PRIPAC_96576 [Pristionchus pacificus]|uniref:Wbp11/ELF5/Saf1 N-terminal domain-containing protein n=1 Tax=Pristionchus pacificus TaxID=54126 RepID=A0A2A6D0S2_PRIPA|nr:hypothetical protein PRIPAC_96576 [Pristionchus pacificus]|eukprot:PDM83989.1 hypothetical protein PRIPAC_34181 [Pristionchus pacificus]